MELQTLLLHPWSVHLPIGVILAAVGFTVYGWYRRMQTYELCGSYLVVVGWFSTLPSLISGTIDAINRLNHPDAHPDTLWWINVHALLAITLVVLLWQAWQLRRRMSDPAWESPRYHTYLWYLVGIFGIVLLSGWTGGHMVYALHIGRLP
ncbi:MAG: hypothetical protein RL076_336 [Chloroflexota bacterium]|jgi:uncharacterized membrane protein